MKTFITQEREIVESWDLTKPTNFTPKILWKDPPVAAQFLNLTKGLEIGDLDDND